MTLEVLERNIRTFLHDPYGDRWERREIFNLVQYALFDLSRQTKYLVKERLLDFNTPNNGVYPLPCDMLSLIAIKVGDDCFNPSSKWCRCDLASDDNNKYFYKYGANQKEVIFSSDLEVASNGTSFLNPIRVKYYAKPYLSNTINERCSTDADYFDPTADLPIDDAYVEALQHYVCGNLLRNDRDSNSRSLGNDELKLYTRIVAKLKIDRSYDFESGKVLTLDRKYSL